MPLLADSLAYCECRVAEDVVAGTHRVFLADVTRAVAREGSPLTYFRGKFGRFEVEQDRIVYGELRSRILSRAFSLDDSLDVGTLAKELDVLPATVYHAVTKLVADGLLARDPERGYVVKPVTAAVVGTGVRRPLRDGAGRRGDDRRAGVRTSGSRACGR